MTTIDKRTYKGIFVGISASLVLGASLFLVLPAFAQSSSGGIGGRTTNIDPENPRTQSIFIYTMKHDEQTRDAILVANHTDEEKTILLSSVDGVVTNTGAYTCKQESEPVIGMGGWLKLDKDEVTLPAGGEEKVGFTVTVPANADVGEHNGCIAMQADQAPTEASGGVRVHMRQAIRTVLTIPGELKRDLTISQFEVKTDKTKFPEYLMSVKNTGNVSADVDMRVRVKNSFGNEVFVTGGEYPVIPNETLTQNFNSGFRPMFGGWLTAEPSIRYDKRLGIFGTQDQSAEFETKQGEVVKFFLWPTMLGWTIIATALIGVILLVSWVIVSRNKDRELRKNLAKYTVKAGDTIESLARAKGRSWQDVAKINNLKAPYALSEGQEIILPGKKEPKKPTKTEKTSKKEG